VGALADERGGGTAEKPLRRGVDVDDTAPDVQDHDAVDHALNEGRARDRDEIKQPKP